ncbi:MAG TPA: lysophospholipid acyltransferase family protein [Candidatus Limnocylindria bacterium]|nr:lysophospholipid acyltransferase family protein [Candidatus Limnocylindria bacterium]
MVRAVALALFPMKLEGRERIPTRGPYIVVANHVNWKDPPALEFTFGVAIRFMAKIEAFGMFFLGGLLRGIGCFPVRRGEADRRAVVTCLHVLRAGNPLGFFPEGTRSRERKLGRAHPGIAFLALRSEVPILPVGVTGTPEAKPFRSDILVRVGEPFRASELPEAATHDEQAVADAIMRRVAALLPEQMRGYYSDAVQKRT